MPVAGKLVYPAIHSKGDDIYADAISNGIWQNAERMGREAKNSPASSTLLHFGNSSGTWD